MEFWTPDFDRGEIYNRLKGFYNHVLGTAGMQSVQTNDKALQADIDLIRSALKGGSCKLYVLSKKGQEHLILEYPNFKNEVFRNEIRNARPHFFSDRRFYLLPNPEHFVFFKNEISKNGGHISIEVMIDKLRVTDVIQEEALYDKLVYKKDKLPTGYQIRKIDLDGEVFRSLDHRYQGPRPNLGSDWGFEDHPEHFEIDRSLVASQATSPMPQTVSQRSNPQNKKLIFEGRVIPLNDKEFDVFIKDMINQIKIHFHRDSEVEVKIKGFLVAIRFKLDEQAIVDPAIFKTLGRYYSMYRHVENTGKK